MLSVPSLPTLSLRSVHVWTINLLALEKRSPEDLLAADERERRDRLRFEEDRRRFAVTRMGLRLLLGGYSEADPAGLSFAYSPAGKPSLAGVKMDIRFNVSHSHEYAMVAIGRGQEIGADLEFQREDVQSEDLANRFFSQYERRVLLEIPQAERTAAFFKIWTAKEALIKAMGVGLALPLDSFDVALQPISGSLLVATRPKSSEPLAWRVQSLPAPNGYVAALATEGQVDPPQMLDW